MYLLCYWTGFWKWRIRKGTLLNFMVNNFCCNRIAARHYVISPLQPHVRCSICVLSLKSCQPCYKGDISELQRGLITFPQAHCLKVEKSRSDFKSFFLQHLCICCICYYACYPKELMQGRQTSHLYTSFRLHTGQSVKAHVCLVSCVSLRLKFK